jgi:hypothetical protein
MGVRLSAQSGTRGQHAAADATSASGGPLPRSPGRCRGGESADRSAPGAPAPATGGTLRTTKAIVDFYVDGFRRMTVGRALWKIIIVKLVFMFVVLKLFFFPDFLQTRFADDSQRAQHVFERMHDAAVRK